MHVVLRANVYGALALQKRNNLDKKRAPKGGNAALTFL